jgi:hypothetical protein
MDVRRRRKSSPVMSQAWRTPGNEQAMPVPTLHEFQARQLRSCFITSSTGPSVGVIPTAWRRSSSDHCLRIPCYLEA